MQIVRRLYLYIVSGVSLAMLLVGLGNLGGTLIEIALVGGILETTARQTIATAGAAALVGLPVWAVHWTLAQRLTSHETAERTSVLRRLYLYLALGALLATGAVVATQLLVEGLSSALGLSPFDPVHVLRGLWHFALAGAFWAYTYVVGRRDRDANGEARASATLRRWYAYGAQFVAALTVLFGSATLMRSLWLNVLQPAQVLRADLLVPTTTASTLVALAVWVFHRQWTEQGDIARDDRHATLRAVEGFAIVGLSVVLTLSAAGQALFYVVARLLGVPNPGNAGADVLVALGAPISTIIVYGIAWALFRQRLARDAGEAEAQRQAGVRRLYTHLVALVSLAVLAVGVSGVLWTLADLLFSPAVPLTPPSPPAAVTPSASGVSRTINDVWREQVSLFVTLVIVALPVWLLHWRPAPVSAERLTLSRRLYLFGVLLASVLALLGSSAYLVYRLLNLALATGPNAPALEIGRAFSVAVVALAVAAYHLRVLRQDTVQPQAPGADLVAGVASEPATARLLVEIDGASESAVREALSHLPRSATYTVRRIEDSTPDPQG